MKNFLKALEEIKEKTYTITDKGRIQQKEQLELKNLLTTALLADLEDHDIQVMQIQKGIAIMIENDEEGMIPVEVNLVTKPLDYDVYGLHDEFITKQSKQKGE